MLIEKPRVELMTIIDGDAILRHLELCCRTAYKSESNVGKDSHYRLIKTILNKHHDSVLEHFAVSFRVFTSIAISREFNRHRFLSITERSTRYCNYSKEKMGSNVVFCQPSDFEQMDEQVKQDYVEFCRTAEHGYLRLISANVAPQRARDLLPLGTMTEVVYTGNLREWRHVLKLRTSPDAHPDARHIANLILSDLQARIPIVFDDILKTEW